MTMLAYLDCPTGLSGDMCLGALVHAGVPLDYLKEHLQRLGIEREYRLWSERVRRQGQQATRVCVDLLEPVAQGHHPHPSHSSANPVHSHPVKPPPPSQTLPHEQGDGSGHPHHSRHLSDIVQLIQAAHLPQRVESASLAVFRRLAEAEGAVHGVSVEQVHFHEVGATDAIIDIVGTCLGLEWLGIDHLYCSAMPTGGGTIRAAHGVLPVPVPAVMKLWEIGQVPIYHSGINRELVTPTGAAIAVTLADQFGPPPPMILQGMGLGAGTRDLPTPNILRLWIGEGNPVEPVSVSHLAWSQIGLHPGQYHAQPMPPSSPAPGQDIMAVLETQIDDLSPQGIGYTLDALFSVGAVDVFTQSIGMKKSRPGILLTVICPPERIAACQTVLFQETTTLGIRHALQQRSILHREIQTVETPYGAIRVKVARYPDSQQIANIHPEYEDCAQIARAQGLPWQEVHRIALHQWHTDNP